MRSILSVKELSVNYGPKLALDNVSVNIPSGKIVGVIGPNGSGKTSFLKAILGLISSSSEYVKFKEAEVSKHLSQISYVPQRESIDWNFPVSVMDVVLMGRYSKKSLFRRSNLQDKKKALEALDLVGLADLGKRQIGQLSGGQQQRTLVARALARDAELFLLDEPFAGVDANTERTLLQLFGEMTDQGKSVVMVHHDLYAVKNYFDHIILLCNKLIADGEVDDVLTQENLNKAYGGLMSFLNIQEKNA